MASVKDTASFFTNGNSKQFDFVLKLYPQVLRLKAEKRTKKPEELIKLDDWYQNELPRRIKQRGKDAHLVHEELVQAMKWKQSRGKFYPQLSYLIKVNTPRAVMQETKKAFRKLPNLEQALTALSNLKGVGTTMASALLAAAAPDSAPFMADECLMAIPEIEGIDYTTKEYLNFVTHIQTTTARLNSEKDAANLSWSAHRVELAIWTHYVASELAPELLEELPTGTGSNNSSSSTTTTTITTVAAPDSPSTTTSSTVESLSVVDESSTNSTITNNHSGAHNNTNGCSTPNPDSDESSNLEAASSSTTTTITTNTNNTNNSSSCSSTTNNDVTTSTTPSKSAAAATAAAGNASTTQVTTTTSSNPDDTSNDGATGMRACNDDDEDDDEEDEDDEEDDDEEDEDDEVTKDSSSSGGDEVVGTTENGKNGNGLVIDSSQDESTRSEDSLEKPILRHAAGNEETNTNDSDSVSSAKRSLDCESSDTPTENSEPEVKKKKTAQTAE